MIRIHPIQTGRVRVKAAQMRREEGGGAGRLLFGSSWSEWLPITAWVVEHPEGIIVVDAGETARTSESGYFPWWQPYFRLAVRFDVAADLEIGLQLREIGIGPDEVWKVVLTHLHSDHAGGLHHFPKSEIIASAAEYRGAQGLSGKLQGYLPHRWPEWFSPEPVRFEPGAVGPFEMSYPLTEAGDVIVVPTPGHTPHHVSVIVRTEGLSYFLAGDTSYNEELLLARQPDGVSPDVEEAARTIEAILEYAAAEPTVYLPTHDPGSAQRLSEKRVLNLAD